MFDYKLMKSTNPDIVLTVLENRNLTIEQANEIINPSIEQYDGMLMKNMSRGIASLKNAIDKGVVCGILVDPDCDGYCSASMIDDFVTSLNGKNNIIYHKENIKAHGVNKEVFNYVVDNNIKYLICPDSASTLEDYKRISKLANEHDVEILILDHHEAEYKTDNDNIIMININQEDDKYPNKCLSGAAVTYKFIREYSKIHNIDIGTKYIDLCAVSIVSDMMRLDELENRVLYNEGSIKTNITSPLLEQFIVSKSLEGDAISIEQIAFSIANMINATIRSEKQEDKEMLFKSFYTRCFVPSNKRGNLGAMEDIHEEILRRMNNNKASQDKPVKSGFEKIRTYIESNNINDKIMLLDVQDFIDRSATGLVANKLAGHLNKTVMLYRTKKSDNTIVGGSVRVKGIDDFKDICNSTGLFEFCSGHQGSFGFEIKKDNLEKLQNTFNEMFKDVEFDNKVEVDAVYNIEVPLNDIIAISELKDLWCNQIKEPLFLVKNVELDTSKIQRIGNFTYTFKSNNMSFTKNFGSLAWATDFAKGEMFNKKARYPFVSKPITADILCKFKKNKQGYAYIEIVDTKSKIIENI